MAADALVTVFDRPVPAGVLKLFRHPAKDGGEVLLGCSGHAALVTILRTGLKLDAVPAADEDGQAFADAVALAVTGLAREHGVTEDGQLDGAILLGWNGRLWTLAHAVAIYHHDGIATIGSGEGPAIGAMDALLALGDDPAGVVKKALSIAINRDRHTAGPVTYEELSAAQSTAKPTAKLAAKKARKAKTEKAKS